MFFGRLSLVCTCVHFTCVVRSVSTCGFAITFFLRFYSRKSMRRNSTFVSAAACCCCCRCWTVLLPSFLALLPPLALLGGSQALLLQGWPSYAFCRALQYGPTRRAHIPLPDPACALPCHPRRPQIIAASCLFLASKVNDEPKPQPHLTIELFKCWFGRRNPRLEKTPENARFLANLHEIVLAAEEAGECGSRVCGARGVGGGAGRASARLWNSRLPASRLEAVLAADEPGGGVWRSCRFVAWRNSARRERQRCCASGCQHWLGQESGTPTAGRTAADQCMEQFMRCYIRQHPCLAPLLTCTIHPRCPNAPAYSFPYHTCSPLAASLWSQPSLQYSSLRALSPPLRPPSPAVLFTIGFDFNVDLVYKHMVDLLKSERFKPLRYDVKFQQVWPSRQEQ